MGVMLFPDNLDKAKLWAARTLSRGIVQQARVTGHSLGETQFDELLQSASVDIALKAEIQQSALEGQATGEVIKMLYAFILQDRKSASWTKAINRTIREWKALGKTVGSSTVKKHIAAKRRVLYLWGAWALSERRRGHQFPFVAVPGTEYDGFLDARVFLAEAELLLKFLVDWARERRNLWNNNLDADHFRLSLELAPPDWSDSWPEGAGTLPKIAPTFFRPRAKIPV
jgi:hypothetical protein